MGLAVGPHQSSNFGVLAIRCLISLNPQYTPLVSLQDSCPIRVAQEAFVHLDDLAVWLLPSGNCLGFRTLQEFSLALTDAAYFSALRDDFITQYRARAPEMIKHDKPIATAFREILLRRVHEAIQSFRI